jgi:hypothetical protein
MDGYQNVRRREIGPCNHCGGTGKAVRVVVERVRLDPVPCACCGRVFERKNASSRYCSSPCARWRSPARLAVYYYGEQSGFPLSVLERVVCAVDFDPATKLKRAQEAMASWEGGGTP